MENWTLHRIGYDEPVFALQNHIPIIRIGRANEVHKQCLGKTYINTYICEGGFLNLVRYFNFRSIHEITVINCSQNVKKLKD